MRELLEVWRNTRLVVQVAVTAALYAAVLIPFKAIAVIIPGVTELRPANAVPIVCALLFGPAAAWGAAFGNLIGDFFGTLGPGSIFGFIGNFLYAYVPYRVWGAHRLASRETGSHLLGGRGLIEYLLATAVASLVCAAVISWGAELVGAAPFKILSVAITLNNFLVAVVLGPPLLAALYPRVRGWGLLHWQLLGTEPVRRSLRVTLGMLLCWAGAVAVPLLGLSVPADQAVGMAIVVRVAPAITVLALGALLI